MSNIFDLRSDSALKIKEAINRHDCPDTPEVNEVADLALKLVEDTISVSKPILNN